MDGATPGRLGEVVATTTVEFQAQALRLHQAPPLGALVRVSSREDTVVYGVVAGSLTEGLDTGSRPIARAREGCEDADVYREHPDLALVLRTCFQCIVVGYAENGRVRRYLPSSPPPLHYSVSACSTQEICDFTASFDYFRMILAVRNEPVEEVLGAHVRFAAAHSTDPYHFRVRAGRELAALMNGDHQRLVTVLQRIRPDPPSGLGSAPIPISVASSFSRRR